jgi:hypothetical protein
VISWIWAEIYWSWPCIPCGGSSSQVGPNFCIVGPCMPCGWSSSIARACSYCGWVVPLSVEAELGKQSIFLSVTGPGDWRSN